MEAALRNDLRHTEFCLGRPLSGGEAKLEQSRHSGVCYTTTQNVGGHHNLSNGTSITDINYSHCTCFPMIESQGS